MTYLLHIIAMTGMTWPSVLGYNLVLGKGKILHFGPIAVGLIAAYSIFLVQQSTGSFTLGLLSGLLGTSLISMLFAWLALRLEGDGLGILSIAMHLAVYAVIMNWSSLTRGALGITMIPRLTGLSSLPAFAIATVVIGLLYMFFMMRVHRSRLGRSMTALAENRAHAESLGINRSGVYIAAFLIAGLGSFLTNSLYAQYLGILHPNDYTYAFLIYYIMIVVAGKPGSVIGVSIANILLTVLKEGLRFVPMPYGLVGPLRLVLFGVILIAAVWFRRKELFPMERTV